jgi:hypothetical protein
MDRKCICIALMVLSCVGSAVAQQLDKRSDLNALNRKRTSRPTQRDESPVQHWLDQNIESVSWDERPLEVVIRWARDLPGRMNIDVDWYVLESAGVDRQAPVTLELRDVPLHQVLVRALRKAGGDERLAFYGIDNILTITTEEEMVRPESLVIRTYNVIDLIRALRSFGDGPSIDITAVQPQSSGSGGASGTVFKGGDDDNEDTDLEDRVEAVVNMIITTIEPASWSVNGGRGTIAAHRDTIVVRNTISVHERLGGPVRARGFAIR